MSTPARYRIASDPAPPGGRQRVRRGSRPARPSAPRDGGRAAWDVPLESPAAERVDVFTFDLRSDGSDERSAGELRQAIARTLRLPPHAVEVPHEGHGHLDVTPTASTLDLRFSVARANGLAAVAVAPGREVAVALEPTRGVGDDHEAFIAAATHELRGTLARLGPRAKLDALARCAAADRLRALVFRAGAREPGDCDELLRSAASPLGLPLRVESGGTEWGLRSFTAGPCHAGALLARGCDWQLRSVRCRRMMRASEEVPTWMDGAGI